MDILVRVAFYIVIGTLLLIANLWFVRSAYRAVSGPGSLLVRISVAGAKDERAALESSLAHMVTVGLRRIQESLSEEEETRPALSSVMANPTPPSSVVANPVPPAYNLVDRRILAARELTIPEETDIKVAIGGVNVEGVFRWVQRIMTTPRTLTFSVYLGTGASGAAIAGNLEALGGTRKGVLWIESVPTPVAIAEIIAYAVAQKSLASPASPVDALDVREFRTLIDMLPTIRELNRKLDRDRVPVIDEFRKLLTNAEQLQVKVPYWCELTYLTANLADSAGDSQKALALYTALRDLPKNDETAGIYRDIQQRIVQRIEALTPEVKPPPSSAPTIIMPATDRYGQPMLTVDREVRAILEIDWVTGTPQPELHIQTQTGTESIEAILAEVGIRLEVRWSTELPVTVMGPDDRFSETELMQTMQMYREKTPEGYWHFYLIYGGRHDTPGIMSLMFDDQQRQGAAVFTDTPTSHRNDPVFMILHEIGHMLNLPHPWQAYGDTRSVMSFPFRWQREWAWDDPSVFRFDDFGKRHVRRAPETYVQPGGSRFLDYGVPLPWSMSAGASASTPPRARPKRSSRRRTRSAEG